MFWFFFLCVLMSFPVLYLNVLVWLLTSCLFEHLYVSDALQQFVRDVFHLQSLLLIVLKGHLCVGWSLLLHTLCSDAAVMSSVWVSALRLHISVSVSLCVLGEDGPSWPTCLPTASPQPLLGLQHFSAVNAFSGANHYVKISSSMRLNDLFFVTCLVTN